MRKLTTDSGFIEDPNLFGEYIKTIPAQPVNIVADADTQGGFVIPKVCFTQKKGRLARLCRRLGKWLFLLGHDQLHPYEAFLSAINKAR